MKHQFHHESHNRQDRTRKERGTPGPIDGGEGKSTRVFEKEFSLSHDPASGLPTISVRNAFQPDVASAEAKHSIAKEFLRYLQHLTFHIDGFHFSFRQTAQEFARQNNIETSRAKTLFKATKSAAQQKLEIVMQRFSRAAVHAAYTRLPDGSIDATYQVTVEWQNTLPPCNSQCCVLKPG